MLQWVLFALSVWAANYNYANAAGLLATYFEDVTLIGPMAEALDYKRKSVRNIAAETLVRLLPLLHEEDSNILTSAGRINLRRALLGSNAELMFATLGALDRVGDTEAIPYVRKLVSGAGLAGNDNRIQTAAQQTLFHLSALVEAQRAPQTLLRAASLLEGANEMLLRGGRQHWRRS